MNDATLPWKVKIVNPIRLDLNISKMGGDRDSVPIISRKQLEMLFSNNRTY